MILSIQSLHSLVEGLRLLLQQFAAELVRVLLLLVVVEVEVVQCLGLVQGVDVGRVEVQATYWTH